MTFEERLENYKKDTDFFLVDILKDGAWNTKHDLTWKEARAVFNRAKKNDYIECVNILVEDWEGEDDCLFKEVECLTKEAYRWCIYIDTFEMTPTRWKVKEEPK